MTVLVVGNAAVDRVLRVERLPGAGESVLGADGGRRPGGKGFNQAAAAAAAGGATRFLTALGRDADGAFMAAAIGAAGLTAKVEHVDVATDWTVVLAAPGGENMVATTCAAAERLPSAVARATVASLSRGDLLLTQGNLDPALTAQLLRDARGRGARAILNPSPWRPALRDAVDEAEIVVVNEGERGASRPRAGALVVTTLGAAGARLDGTDGSVVEPAPEIDTDDASGAGDVFAGAFAARLSLGDAPGAALRAATRTATAWLAERARRAAA